MSDFNVQNAYNCLAAINTIYMYLYGNEGRSSEGYWEDKDGNGFYADMGSLFDGLKDLEAYLEDQIKNAKK